MQVLHRGLFADDDDVACVCDSSLIIATAVKPVTNQRNAWECSPVWSPTRIWCFRESSGLSNCNLVCAQAAWLAWVWDRAHWCVGCLCMTFLVERLHVRASTKGPFLYVWGWIQAYINVNHLHLLFFSSLQYFVQKSVVFLTIAHRSRAGTGLVAEFESRQILVAWRSVG